MNEYQQCHDFALILIQEASIFLLEQKKQGFETTAKGGDVRDMVTTVDLVVNDFLIERVAQKYPEHSIYSEEGSGDNTRKEWQWVLDPIDGTSHFARGRMLYSISIGLLHRNQAVINVVRAVETGDVYSWYEGGSVVQNGKEYTTSEQTDLRGAQVALRSGRNIDLAEWGGRSYTALIKEKVKVFNFGSSALDLCYLAIGSLDGVVYGGITTKDIAGSVAMITAAGGVVTDAEGNAITITDQPQKIYAAATTELNEQMRNLLEHQN